MLNLSQGRQVDGGATVSDEKMPKRWKVGERRCIFVWDEQSSEGFVRWTSDLPRLSLAGEVGDVDCRESCWW